MLAGFLVLCALRASAEDASATVAAGKQEFLESVLVHRVGVFASTPKGIYVASRADKKWVPLATDPRMPLGGTFAAEGATCDLIGYGDSDPPAVGPVYYFSSNRFRPRLPEEHAKVYGLYRLDTAKRKWALVSAEPYIEQVYVQRAALFAVVGMKETVGGESHYVSRVLRSKDSGNRWDDIVRGIELGPDPPWIFRDPDHVRLVCLTGYKMILQATDDNYRWRMIDNVCWHHAHLNELFFETTYATRGTFYVHCATLTNYFDYPFGNHPQIPSFQLTTGHAYTFKSGERVVVPLTIHFWDESGAVVKLLDMEDAHAFWGLRRILPDGKRDNVRASRDVARDSPRSASHRLTHGQTYTRSLDLSSIADFSTKGVYHVQLIYENWRIADAAKGEWPGSFSSPVFDVKIE